MVSNTREQPELNWVNERYHTLQPAVFVASWAKLKLTLLLNGNQPIRWVLLDVLPDRYSHQCAIMSLVKACVRVSVHV